MAKNTQLKGDIAKTQAICYFTNKGYDVSLPITESSQYDLIVDTGTELKKVQVKFSSTNSIRTRRIHSNSTGYVVKYYNKNDYDWIFCYTSDDKKYLIKEYLEYKSEAKLKDEWKVE